MPHTQRDALPWLHLRVAGERTLPRDLLLGDFDGELFQDIIDGKEPATAVPALRRADHLAIVLDGDSLVDAEKRHVFLQRTIDLLNVLGEQREAISDPEAIGLVVTKQDAVLRASPEDRAAVQKAVEAVRQATTSAFDGYVPTVVSTAAISRIRDLPLGHGLDELLDLWCRQPFVVLHSDQAQPYAPPPNDWFARFVA